MGKAMTPDERMRLLVRLCAIERDGYPLPDLESGEVDALAHEAEREGVAGWLTHRLTESYDDWEPRDELRLKLRAAAIGTVAHNARILRAAKIITEKLDGIETILLKGAALIDSPYYKDLSHRLAGDIDLWVAPDRLMEARERLLEAGATVEAYDGPQVGDDDAHLPPMKYEGVILELHGRLFYKKMGWDPPEPLGSYATEWHGRRMLRPDAMTHHLVMHAYKHYVWMKVGLRWVVDLAVVMASADDARGLLSLCKSSTPDAEKAIKWAMGVALPLMPKATAKEMEDLGYKPIEFARNRSKGVSTGMAKRWAIERIIEKAVANAARAKGVRGKIRAIVTSIKYETGRTRARYPDDCLLTGLVKRIFFRK